MVVKTYPQLVLDGTFPDIGQMSQAIGWDFDFRQLDQGSLHARASVIAGSGIQLSNVRFNKKFHQVGSAPENILSFGIPRTDVSWCYADVQAGSLININLDVGFEGISPAGFSSYMFSCQSTKLEFLAEQLGITRPVKSLIKKAAYWRSGQTVALGNRIASMFQQLEVSGDTVTKEQSEFVNDEIAICILQELTRDTMCQDVRRDGQRQSVLNRALEILESPEHLPITVAQLCAKVGTSLSTLQRAFLNTFGVSPKSYIRSRILSVIRDELGCATPNTRVFEIANLWGVWHMGQFASDYRRQFGELPSSTLARDQHSMTRM